MDISGWGEGEIFAIFSHKLLSHSSEEFRRGTLLCSKKFQVSKYFRDKSGGRVSRLFLKNVGSRNTESFGRGTILCFRNSRVSNNFMPKSGNQRLPEETLLCPGTKKLRRATFLCIHKNCGIEKKNMDKMGGGKDYHDFPKKIFMSLSFEIFTGIIFSVSNFLGSENFYAYEGNITILCRKFVKAQYRKTS